MMEANLEANQEGTGKSSRLEELAKPKEIKDVCNFFRRLVWGNQETIWPLSSRALMCRPTSRVLGLAKPKKLDGNLQRRSIHLYSCGRASEIWHRPPGIYSIIPSQRILQLAEPRRCPETYLKQRPRSSPEWPVSSAALCWEASPRILSLSHPRSLPSSFCFPKEAETRVSRSAMRASASSRIMCISRPVQKMTRDPLSYDSRYKEAPIRPVTQAALNAVATPRLIELARPKVPAPGSFPDRPPEWPVSAAAKHAVASPRLGELAQPVARATTQFVQFNPDAFVVKETAKKAYCSARVKELAQAVQR
ncbi:sperm microtubule associated protein 2-like [Zootoca vivipara]|uniref:sperm microtubule associated protein 2-like n=1 Tax=Zootoca vivipara TaxID=8524 RepID=UPI00293C0E70|nr:sperm microtubule associated protein 2-like [Zootoca vivipara]XP_060124784.1 sperm microtubule associated protein 2-like [Zootoca vivipara]